MQVEICPTYLNLECKGEALNHPVMSTQHSAFSPCNTIGACTGNSQFLSVNKSSNNRAVQSFLWWADRVSRAPHTQVLEGQPSHKGICIELYRTILKLSLQHFLGWSKKFVCACFCGEYFQKMCETSWFPNAHNIDFKQKNRCLMVSLEPTHSVNFNINCEQTTFFGSKQRVCEPISLLWDPDMYWFCFFFGWFNANMWHHHECTCPKRNQEHPKKWERQLCLGVKGASPKLATKLQQYCSGDQRCSPHPMKWSIKDTDDAKKTLTMHMQRLLYGLGKPSGKKYTKTNVLQR